MQKDHNLHAEDEYIDGGLRDDHPDAHLTLAQRTEQVSALTPTLSLFTTPS